MARTPAMLPRLPPLYREGELVRQVFAVPGLELEALDEEALEVQRSHWFDATLELGEAGRLAAVLDLTPEPWQTLGTFRAWVHAIRDAWLRYGVATKRGLQKFVEQYTDAYQRATRTTVVPRIAEWRAQPSTSDPAFVENPARRRFERVPTAGGIQALHRFTIEQNGLDVSHAGFLLVGLPSGPESVPVVANLTTGQALLYLGNVPPGQRLWIRPVPPGEEGGHWAVEAQLEGDDVSGRLRSVSGLVPGQPWDDVPSTGRPKGRDVDDPTRPLELRRGPNDLWFLPVAHFDELGLDRFLLALPDLLLAQGRYDETGFDRALFFQDPAVSLRLSWVETEPASFEIHLPAGRVRYPAGEPLDAVLEEVRLLGDSLAAAVRRLKPAGVRGAVEMRPMSEIQPQLDVLRAVLPLTHREVGPSGRDDLPDSGALFDVTDLDDSLFR